MAPRTRDPITRLLRILTLLPRAPRKIGTRALYARLRKEGYVVTVRTVERDMQRLRAILPIALDDVHRPFGWSWSKDA